VLLEPELLHAEQVDALLRERADERRDPLLRILEHADREPRVVGRDLEIPLPRPRV
jgi:hypothetical protein